MRLHRCSIVVALLLLSGVSSPASAQGWGREWLEKLSGPGSFQGMGLQFPIACQWNTPNGQRFYWYFQTPEGMSREDGNSQAPRRGELANEASTRRLCIDLQFTSATNQDSAAVGLIAVRVIEGRVGFPLEIRALPWLAAFEPSVAAGAIRFQGDAFNEWRLTLSPEITVKPLKFIRPGRGRVEAPNKRGDWRGLIEVAYGAVLITPSITNEDLRVPFLEPFEHGWLRRAVFFRVNASELVGLR
jgi:hypothetical protein